MNIQQVKGAALTGDVILVHGNSAVQKGIELATDSPFCHVAMLVLSPAGLLVAEMAEGTGYQAMTFGEWVAGRPDDKIFYGVAPAIVRNNGGRIIDSLQEYADPDKRQYGYESLFTVWLSQFTGEDYPTREVCSLFVAHRWEIAGYPIAGCPAPARFLFECEMVSLIRGDE